jgi:hypothetical protein
LYIRLPPIPGNPNFMGRPPWADLPAFAVRIPGDIRHPQNTTEVAMVQARRF